MTTSPRTEIREAIRASTTPAQRRETMRKARDFGLLHLIPEPWRAKAIDAWLDTPLTAAAPTEAVTDYSPEVRREMAAKGHALSGGGYPVANEGDLKRAIKTYALAAEGEKAKVRRHIMKRARALGRSDLIPASWRTASASLEDTLARRVEAFNAQHDAQVSMTKVRTVYLRGVTAHSSVAANTTLTASQYGMARVNSYLRLAAGDPSASTMDADLLASS